MNSKVSLTLLFLYLGLLSGVEPFNTTNESIDELLSLCSNETISPGECLQSRTFGPPRRRIMMLFLPVMFLLGVIVTLLISLTVFALKGMAMGVILLIVSFGGLFAKLKPTLPLPMKPPVNLVFMGPHNPYAPPSPYGPPPPFGPPPGIGPPLGAPYYPPAPYGGYQSYNIFDKGGKLALLFNKKFHRRNQALRKKS